jgi:hypothetical protein
MARRPSLPTPQRRALDRLKTVRGIDRFYLAGGAAIAVHLRHRRGLLDLATNKLAAVAKRGLVRDFWDLYEIGKSGVTLSEACDAYVRRFHVAESDLYHVSLGLTWFEDAEAETVRPKGMTDKLWKTIRRYFEDQAPPLVLSLERPGK